MINNNGRYVAYHTAATNIDAADTDAADDVYMRDTQTGATVLVSRATGASGAKGNAASGHASFSGDGRYIAFNSAATNLDPADSDSTNDVYVRDLQNSTTTLVSRATTVTGAKEGLRVHHQTRSPGRHRAEAAVLHPPRHHTRGRLLNAAIVARSYFGRGGATG